jgi:hypothetical protein
MHVDGSNIANHCMGQDYNQKVFPMHTPSILQQSTPAFFLLMKFLQKSKIINETFKKCTSDFLRVSIVKSEKNNNNNNNGDFYIWFSICII